MKVLGFVGDHRGGAEGGRERGSEGHVMDGLVVGGNGTYFSVLFRFRFSLFGSV